MESTIEMNSKISVNRETEIERNDIIAFNLSSEFGTFFVFRMIAKPGDTLRISDSQIFINSVYQSNPETAQFAYRIETKMTLDDGFFLERGINEFMKTQNGYLIFTSENRASELINLENISSVTKTLQNLGFVDNRMFADFQNSNQDNLETIYLPRAGDVIDSDQLSKYATTILDNEGVDVIELKEYRFRNSYCFVLGDNRHNSLDSRYIGLIPMNNVIGTVKNILP